MPGTIDDTVMEDAPQVEGSEGQNEEEELAPRVRVVSNRPPSCHLLPATWASY